MKARQLLRSHNDWLLVGLLITGALLLAIIAYFALLSGNNSLKTYDELESRNYQPSTSYPALVPPSKKFPPPANTQRNFYEIHTAERVQYSLVWSERNVDRNSVIGPHKFTLELYNTKNAPITVTDKEAKAITIGCIAQDKPYHKVSLAPQSQSFKPLEKKQIVFDVPVSCLYLGTADKKYFWRIY
jgi:hypothetical protein